MSGQTEINTFWKLISNHRVEIPIIQRDYAQGRDSTDDPKAGQVRKEFIRDLVSHLESGVNPLHLDFVYGKINGRIDIYTLQKNRMAIAGLLKSVKSYSETLDISVDYKLTEAGGAGKGGVPVTSFIPLDGQQRLTTLYLLHWYLLTKTKREKSSLLNFTYKTRTSSISFCDALSTQSFIIGEPLDDGSENKALLSEQITDSAWFFAYWRKDPTVKGMITMLDEIDLNLRSHSEARLEAMLDLLINTNAVSFDFLDMDKFQLTDDLYVKMNARGKQLTDFENFKTWLQESVKKDNLQISIDGWHKKIDIQWADLFWKFKKSNTYQVDDQYLGFFNFMALNFYSETAEVKDSKISAKTAQVFEELRKGEYIPASRYKELNSFSAGNLNVIFDTLSFLEKNGYQQVEDVLNPLFGSARNTVLKNLFGPEILSINLWDRCYLSALIKFILFRGKSLNDYDDIDKRDMFRWARVTKNLIYNTTIDSAADYVSALRAIYKLSEHHADIYTYIASAGDEEITSLAPYQVAEEKAKCALIIANHAWEAEMIDAENHEYFYGQIHFLIKFSLQDGTESPENFRKYAVRAKDLFSDTVLGESEKLRLQRALLTKGNYLVPSGSNRSFCLPSRGTLRLREENWRRLFKDEARNTVLKELILDDRPLKEIIDSSSVTGWRSCFIQMPKCIKYCNQRMIKLNQDGEVVLLSQSQMNHKHADLFSYALYLKLAATGNVQFLPFKNDMIYHEVKSSGEQPCAQIKNWIFCQQLYMINIYSEGAIDEFRIEFANADPAEVADEIKTILTAHAFISEDFHWSFYLKEDKVLDTLRGLCAALGKLEK